MASSWMEDKRVLVAIPALNEQASVGDVVRRVRILFPRVDVLLIDDGSSDNTSRVAANAGAMVCRLPFNLGVGGAMRTAYKYAHRSGYDVVVQIDADGQHDPASLEILVTRLARADLVVGARFAGAGAYQVALPRRAAMRFLSGALTRLSGSQLTDVTSGYRAAGPRAIALFAVHYPAEYLGDTVESMVIAIRTGLRVEQLPVEMRLRQAGRASQSNFKSSAYLVRAAVALVLALVRQWPLPDEAAISIEAVPEVTP